MMILDHLLLKLLGILVKFCTCWDLLHHFSWIELPSQATPRPYAAFLSRLVEGFEERGSQDMARCTQGAISPADLGQIKQLLKFVQFFLKERDLCVFIYVDA